jgi:5-methylcytosine-specific restriction endonuclease McrA
MTRKYTESAIKSKLSALYKELYAGNPHPRCNGCGTAAQGTAHIIPKARCKQMGKPELIWDKENVFPACHKCNSIAENPQSPLFLKLLNITTILSVIKKHDPERYRKIPNRY